MSPANSDETQPVLPVKAELPDYPAARIKTCDNAVYSAGIRIS
ncbi:hypothetical protein HMPREF0201_04558 [Cedecea davisae DSM 4568]|uniref:Uncharacterized protein n=1 Tax=Cedecea davisae DSM 4568 TaxID=566551 RepID=S3IIQ6_9ENTR|nr:hypothetical protein HMPREF0201_04558 [Cedecea davisae DSM 4568]